MNPKFIRGLELVHSSFNHESLSVYLPMEMSLRFKLLLWWLKLKKRMSTNLPLIKIGQGGRGASKILFLLPSEKEYAPIAAHFVKQQTTDKEFHFVLHESGLPFYSNQVKENLVTYSDEDLNILGLIQSKPILDRINPIKFDAVVDLNRNLNQTLSFLVLDLDIPLKIGFQSPVADQLFTMVIEPASDGFLEKSFDTIERILGLA